MNTYQSPTTTRGKMVFFIWKIFPRLVLVGLIILIVVLFIQVSARKKAITEAKINAVSQQERPVNTVTYTIQPASIHDRINLPGSIEAWTELNVMAKVNGTVTELLVSEGDEVKKGDVIARIEETDYTIALQRAKAAYNLAKNNFERDKNLHAKGVVTQFQLDTAETTLMTAKADLDNAALQLSRCIITSPINGVISTMTAKTGLFLTVADPIARILKIDTVKAVIGIPESDVAAVRKIDAITFSIQALGNKTWTGKKHFLSPAPETTARLYDLELEVDNSNRDILPGMFIRADIIKQTVDDAIVIPFYAVISRNDEHYVFIEEDGLAKKKLVKLGIMEKWMIEVKQGLKAGDKLIVEGQRDLENDQQINVVKEITNPGKYML